MNEFEWDSKKSKSNLKKHGIAFSEVTSVFDGEFTTRIPDNHPSEKRFSAIGLDMFSRLVVVIYTWRNNKIRIISARKATPNEINKF